MTDQGAAKATPDWEKIEADYRAGVLSLREIADRYGSKESTIRAKARRDDWSRDIAAKVAQRVDRELRKKELRSELRSERHVSERAIIEASAQAIVDIRMAHRGDIRKARALTMTLLTELESTTIDNTLFVELGDLLRNEDGRGQDRRNDLYQKIIDLPSRVDSVKKLSDALKTLIGLEREAYGMADAQKIEVEHKGSLTDKKDPVAAAQVYAEMMKD